MGIKKIFGGLHIIVTGDFYQLPTVMDSYIFKYNPYNYGLLATNLWTTYSGFFIVLCNVKLIGKCNGRNYTTIQKRFGILDHMDGPYIFSMLLAFSRIFKTMLSHCGSVSPLIQPSKIRYF